MDAAKHTVERKSLEQREKMSELERLRHSAAHIMAAAVLRIWPDAMLDTIVLQAQRCKRLKLLEVGQILPGSRHTPHP